MEYFQTLQQIMNGDADKDIEDLMRRFATVPMTSKMIEDYVALSKLK